MNEMRVIRIETEWGIEIRSYFAGRQLGGAIRADHETMRLFGPGIEQELVSIAATSYTGWLHNQS